jgi:hypothetical protein
MKTTRKPREQSPIARKTIRLIVNECKQVAFEAFQWDMEKWAAKAGVHCQTIYRLLREETRFPSFETVIRLANAVHIDIVTQEGGSVALRIQGTKRKTLLKSKKRVMA